MDSATEPLVRYGQVTKGLPGDPDGWKLRDCGNVAHWFDQERLRNFPRFPHNDFKPSLDPRVELVKEYLEGIRTSGFNHLRSRGELVRNTDEEAVIDTVVADSFTARIVLLKDVTYKDKQSYKKAKRARVVKEKSIEKMKHREPPISKPEQDFLIASRIYHGEASKVPQFYHTKKRPEGGDDKAKWYKMMRDESIRSFWIEKTEDDRPRIRTEVKNPPGELHSILKDIEKEDKSLGKDFIYAYQQDDITSIDNGIYEKVDKDICVAVDRDSQIVLCRFSALFRFLYGDSTMAKVEDAMRKWSSLPPLPVPDTSRHMVDDYIRQKKHPELDLEKATTLREIEERHQCVVHYGTWAQKGHPNPDLVFKTPDTLFERGHPTTAGVRIPHHAFPHFTQAFGLGSEVVRFLFQNLCPQEYLECIKVFEALDDNHRVNLSPPTFSTLFVLGINSFTGRHSDDTDVEYGIAGLVALGDYDGGDICFPQLGMRFSYQPGDCVIFRGRELEHFVADWSGYRIFLLYTNHQPVRNYAYRMMGKLPLKPNDYLFHPDKFSDKDKVDQSLLAQASTTNEDAYDPCYMSMASQEPEELWEDDIYGPAYIPQYPGDRGQLVVPLPSKE